MKFEEKRRLLVIGQAGIAIAGPHLHGIQQLDARNGNAHLDRHNDGIAGRFDIRKGASAASDLLRNALQAQRDRGQHAERTLRADEEPRQIVAGRRFPGAPCGADFLAIGGDNSHGQHIVLHRAVAHRVRA